MSARSLLSGDEGFVTYKITLSNTFHALSYVWNALSRVLPDNVTDSLRGMRAFKEKNGACFDVPEAAVASVQDNLKSDTFVIEKATSLPELAE